MLFRKQSRPFDPTGKATLNLVIGEGRSFSTAEDRIFIPSHGPFYTESVIVLNGAKRLTRGVDYECLLLYADASKATAKEVGVAIKILDPTITGVNYDYQVVGGKYQDVIPVLRDLMANLGDELVSPIRWADIVGKPDKYNAAAHKHPYWAFSGWGVLLTPLDKILNGIHYQDRRKFRDTYDYYYAKMGQFETTMDQLVKGVSDKLASNYLFYRDPLNTVKIKTTAVNPATNRDGSWVEIADKVVGFAKTPALLGTTIPLSEEIVYPQPDNIILNETDIPILRDDDEWIYQDNEYPVYPGVVEDYDEEIDEQFDLLYVKGYIKTAHGNGYSASVSSSKVTMVEGDTTTITLTTFKFTPGLRVPYAIEGVGAENITIPKYGYVNIGLNGNASISFTLKTNSPRTDSNKFTVEFAIMGGVKTTVPYTLNANSTYTGKIGAFDGMNDIVQTKHVVGDTFYICISQHGLSGKTVRLTGLFSGQGNHQLHINNTVAVGTNGGYVDIVMPANGADLYVPVRSTQVGKVATSSLNFSLSYNSVVLSTYSVSAELMKLEAFWMDSTTNQQITTIKDTKPFKLVVKHNSNQSLNFALAVTENTVIGEITPDIPTSLFGTMNGVVESNNFVVNRGDRSMTDRLTVKVISPRESSDTVSPTITFQPS